MNQSIKHVGVFTSGGDSPGMNTALYAITKIAEVKGIKESGFRKGYEGLIDGDLTPLKLQKMTQRGGTILKNHKKQMFYGIGRP